MFEPVPPAPQPVGSPPSAVHPRTLDLKNRLLAAVLALLVPGLGHLYQGRTFKAVVYSVCILGLFFTGQALGDWKVVYLSDNVSGGRMGAGGGIKRLLQGYGAQWPVGLAAWPAMWQSRRYHDATNIDRPRLDAPLETTFSGALLSDTAAGPQPLLVLDGTLNLEPVGGGIRGRFRGTDAAGQPIEFDLQRVRELGQPISANEERTFDAIPAELPAGLTVPANAGPPYLRGGIPRPFWDRYQVPLGEQGENRLTGFLGGRLEIAYVFTWIAGLLNVLAIWDALDGPAYGWGDEPELNQKKPRKRRRTAAPPADPTPAPHAPTVRAQAVVGRNGTGPRT